MPGLQLFKKGFYSHIGANQPIVAATINLGSTKGRGSSTRIFNYCNQHSANPSECINQFINIIPAPAPAPPPPPPPTPPNTTILEYNGDQGATVTWDTVTFTRDISLSNFSYTAITTSIPAVQVPTPGNLIGVTIGNNVTTIGSNAFQFCSGLISITIPDSVTSIGPNTFEDCTGLTTVTIGNSVTSISNYAFHTCTALISLTIGSSVTSIGEFAFATCTSLTSVTIPNSVTTIGLNAFNDCALTSVTFTPTSTLTSIGIDAFQYCSGLTSITIPDSVTSIGIDAFQYCSGLTTVYISAGVAAALGTLLGYTWTSTGPPGTPIPAGQFYNAPAVNFILP